ncbi:circadian clock-controlled protein daywake [Halyomorpha halys]|uniref:circadian clock-controlled protein daywake n=1 Tax=Halyomorpha halys TaxID=286706 RepID=UPI0006D4DF46|nr:protein takeout [Halyomorpha halys]XP_014290979.1 protein takeout [Halyomorpha halys]
MEGPCNALFIASLCLLVGISTSQKPYFLHTCQKNDPNINQCLTYAANHLATHVRTGIPELGMTEVEPIVLDEINLALGSGPDGYRATFRDIKAYGISNLTITGVRSDLNSLQLQFSFYIPKIAVRAKYRSSGVLIMVQATGGGDYWGQYDGVRAKTYLRASKQNINGVEYLNLEDLKMDFSVRELKMGIENVHNGNTVIEAALNLFINSHSQELLREMKPSIKSKLLQIMGQFVDNLFQRIPYKYWISE